MGEHGIPARTQVTASPADWRAELGDGDKGEAPEETPAQGPRCQCELARPCRVPGWTTGLCSRPGPGLGRPQLPLILRRYS